MQSRGDTEGVCENKREAPALDLCQGVLRLALLHAVMVIIILPVIIHVILLILVHVIFVSFVILVSNIMSGWSGALLKLLLLSIIVNLYFCIFVYLYLCICVFFIGKGSG